MAQSVVIDANLLVLFVFVLTDRRLIGRHKNLSAYDEDGFDLLLEQLREYRHIVLTAQALTETSNLLRQIADPDRSRLMLVLKALIDGHEEHFIGSRDAASEPVFVRLGLTDAALIAAARRYGSIFSADKDLCVAAGRAGVEVLNFAHLYDAAFG